MSRRRPQVTIEDVQEVLSTAIYGHAYQAEQWAENATDYTEQQAGYAHEQQAQKCRDALAVIVGTAEAASVYAEAQKAAARRVHGD